MFVSKHQSIFGQLPVKFPQSFFMLALAFAGAGLTGCGPSDKPGSTRYLDYTNGIGGIVLGQPLSVYERMGFALNSTSEWGGTCYTNASLSIPFGPSVLTNIQLITLGAIVVGVNGDVIDNEAEEPVEAFLTTLFGEKTGSATIDHQSPHVDIGVTYTSATHTYWRWWKGMQADLSLSFTKVETYVDGHSRVSNVGLPRLSISNAKAIEKAKARMVE